MKLRHFDIYRFGKLKDKSYDFGDGFTLISGKNESGKTTMHTAAAVMLFGLERGRGRAAANDTYKTYLPWEGGQVYGGALEWEREGHVIRAERDLTKTPPRSVITDTFEGTAREIPPAEIPWPPSLSPYLYFNTLSFRQMGSGVEGGMADELRSHIVNLQSSGDEDLSVADALAALRTKRRALQKSLRPEAPQHAAVLEEELRRLEQESFVEPAGDWDEAQGALKQQEARIESAAAERGSAQEDLARKKRLLTELGLEDRAAVEKDLAAASSLTKQLAVYERDYAASKPSPKASKVLSLLMLPLLFVFLWFALRSLQNHEYLYFGLSAAAFFLAMLASTRFTRKTEAHAAYLTDQTLLAELLGRYLPDYTPRGSAEEAGQLAGYLQKVVGVFDHIEEESESLREQTDSLAGLIGQQEKLSKRLKEEMTSKVRREQWEARVRSVMDQLEGWKPILKENERIRKEIEAVDLAGSTLSTLAQQVASDFGTPLTETASGIFREITGGRYEGVRISSELELYAVQDHQLIAPGALSGGTMEQLYFAFRMAVIRLLWPKEDMPLFFDDSFAYYDNERLTALIRWLARSYGGQIFLFTCQEREEEVLRSEGIPYQKIEL